MIWFVYAVLSAFLAALASIVEKHVLARVHSTDFSLLISFLVAVLSLPFFFILPLDTLTPKVLFAIWLASLLGSFAFLEITKGVRHLEISNSAPLFLLSPFLTALLAYFVIGETLTNLQLLGVGLLALGTYVLETKNMRDVHGFITNFFGDRYARFIFLGLIFYAVTSIIDRIILSRWGVPPMLLVSTAHIFILINFSLYFISQHRSALGIRETLLSSWRELLLLALLMFAYRLAYAYAVALAAIALVVAIKRSSSLFTTIIGGQLFHDHSLLRKSVACTIMICGVALMALP